MSVVSFRIDDELRRKMRRLSHINWSEVVRKAIAERVALEEALGSMRKLDLEAVETAVKGIDRLRSKTSGRWSGAEEVRKWRDLRRLSSTPR
ncbi:MAG: hypothetical protein RMK31_00085 [Candidatus Caldarchaeum sp.]|nr:hypothetical protein [Candidatus Caldarchaeum sp.]